MTGPDPSLGIVLTVQNPLRFILQRLRQGVADKNRFSDVDILQVLNDGHVSLCEQSRYLRTLDSFPLVAGQQEYGLPPNTCEVMRVYVAGQRQTPVALDEAQTGLPGPYYYQFDSQLGFTQDVGDGTAWIYYARRPVPMLYDDIPAVPPESYHLLRHYAAWRLMTLQSGAAAVAEALLQRAIFDQGVLSLREETQKETAPRRLPVLGGGVGAR